MRNAIGIVLTVILLIYGMVRIGVGSALLAQLTGIVDFPDLLVAIQDVGAFLTERQGKQIIPLTLHAYFAYIIGMGFLLATGAIGIIYKKLFGFILLSIYILFHAALFVNYQEVNPKLFVLGLQIILLIALFYIRPPRQPSGA